MMNKFQFIWVAIFLLWGCAQSTESPRNFELICKVKCTEQEMYERKKYDFANALTMADFEKIKYYIENKIFRVNDVVDEEYMYTPLRITSYYRNPRYFKIAQYLIENGANVNKKNGGMATTPLLTAIWKHNNEAAKLLLTHGADINIKSDRGYDACVFAHRWSNFEIMPYLKGCCQRIRKIEPEGILKEELLRPPGFYQNCKND